MEPMMTATQKRILEKLFLGLKRKKIDVLEWGSGGSTVYFTHFLKKHDIAYHWISVEYNKKWHQHISQAVKTDKQVKVVLFDTGNDHLKQRHTNMDDYVSYAAKQGKKYDFIFVDGRKRRRCLIETHKLLKPDGIVILHDAQRKYYHCAFPRYPNSRFIEFNLWVGRNRSVSPVHKILNRINYLYYVYAVRLMKKLFR